MSYDAALTLYSDMPSRLDHWRERSARMGELAVGWSRSDAEHAPRMASLHARLACRYARLARVASRLV